MRKAEARLGIDALQLRFAPPTDETDEIDEIATPHAMERRSSASARLSSASGSGRQTSGGAPPASPFQQARLRLRRLPLVKRLAAMEPAACPPQASGKRPSAASAPGEQTISVLELACGLLDATEHHLTTGSRVSSLLIGLGMVRPPRLECGATVWMISE